MRVTRVLCAWKHISWRVVDLFVCFLCYPSRLPQHQRGRASAVAFSRSRNADVNAAVRPTSNCLHCRPACCCHLKLTKWFKLAPRRNGRSRARRFQRGHHQGPPIANYKGLLNSGRTRLVLGELRFLTEKEKNYKRHRLSILITVLFCSTSMLYTYNSSSLLCLQYTAW